MNTLPAARPEIVSRSGMAPSPGEPAAGGKGGHPRSDAIAARRRRLPMVKFSNDYVFDTPAGTAALLDLFDGRAQLVVYQFMDNGPDDYCPAAPGSPTTCPTAGPAVLAARG